MIESGFKSISISFHLFAKIRIHVRADFLKLLDDIVNVIDYFRAVERHRDAGNRVDARNISELLSGHILR